MAFLTPGDLIVCDGVPGSIGATGKPLPVCDYGYLIFLAKELIQTMILISTILAAVVFAYIGFILLTSGGDPSAMTRAKGMFGKVLKGYLWILFAWIIVYTITNTLLKDGYYLLSN